MTKKNKKHFISYKGKTLPTTIFTEKEIKEMVDDGGKYIGKPIPRYLWKYKAFKI